MAALPPGIDPDRDPDTHAWLLDVFGEPDMPESFNWVLQQIALNANVRVGTKARRERAIKDGDVWPGLCWITLPDDPAQTSFAPRPLYWTGAAFTDPLLQQRARLFDRNDYFNGYKSGINGNLRTSVMQGTWPNAPAGQYRFDYSFSMDGPEVPKKAEEGVTGSFTATNDMVIAVEANNVSLRPDYLDDIGPITRNYSSFALLNDHKGGDLRVEIYAFINGTTGTLYSNGTGILMQYLGPYLHG